MYSVAGVMIAMWSPSSQLPTIATAAEIKLPLWNWMMH